VNVKDSFPHETAFRPKKLNASYYSRLASRMLENIAIEILCLAKSDI